MDASISRLAKRRAAPVGLPAMSQTGLALVLGEVADPAPVVQASEIVFAGFLRFDQPRPRCYRRVALAAIAKLVVVRSRLSRTNRLCAGRPRLSRAKRRRSASEVGWFVGRLWRRGRRQAENLGCLFQRVPVGALLCARNQIDD